MISPPDTQPALLEPPLGRHQGVMERQLAYSLLISSAWVPRGLRSVGDLAGEGERRDSIGPDLPDRRSPGAAALAMGLRMTQSS